MNRALRRRHLKTLTRTTRQLFDCDVCGMSARGSAFAPCTAPIDPDDGEVFLIGECPSCGKAAVLLASEDLPHHQAMPLAMYAELMILKTKKLAEWRGDSVAVGALEAAAAAMRTLSSPKIQSGADPRALCGASEAGER
jgi:hypothetical protein